MSKLLTEPRIPKAISEPKPRRKKSPKSDVPVEVTFKLLKESSKKRVNELFRIYKESPLHARVKFFNSEKNTFSFNRLVVFEFGNGEFEISYFKVSFGISVTNRIYSSQKKECSITYKKGKFYYFNPTRKMIFPLTYGSFINFIRETENVHLKTFNHKGFHEDVLGELQEIFNKSRVYTYFKDRFPWIRMLSEHPLSNSVNFNVLISKKLYGGKDINRHVMKIPNNIAKLVLNSQHLDHLKNNEHECPIKQWYEILKVLEHVDHLREDMLNDHLFIDTCKMARTLGRKVNCKWGLKRLKDEHDSWVMEITNIVLDCEVEYDLKIKPVFVSFAEFSGYKLLKTNKDLLREGMLQHHCVGTYIDQVNNGSCGIYHVNGYTLQVKMDADHKLIRERPKPDPENPDKILMTQSRYVDIPKLSSNQLKTNQFRGMFNDPAPVDLTLEVEMKMVEFRLSGELDKALLPQPKVEKLFEEDENEIGDFEEVLDF